MQRFDGKKLLIMGANPETASLVLAARAAGIETHVADYNPLAYSKRVADVPVNIDASHVDELVDYARTNHIDGVMLGVAEALLPFYVDVCTALNLPCFTTRELSETMVSKERFKNVCREYNVPVVPEFDLDHPDDIRYPIVVKPVDSCSSKGISVVFSQDELEEALAKARSFSASKKVLLEKYMTGEEVVIYYMIQNGNATLVGMCDRYTNKEQQGVAQLPTSYIFPSKYLARYAERTDSSVRQMLAAMGVENGALFLQAFVDDDGDGPEVRIYEPGFRLNGAQEHMILGELTGIDAKELLINYALTGEMAPYPVAAKADPSLHGLWGCKLSPLVRCGHIEHLEGLEEALALSGVVSVNPSYLDGDEVEGLGTLKQIASRFFIVADSPSLLAERIDAVMDVFDVVDTQGQSMLLTPFDTHILSEYPTAS